jgi:plastocyanin
LPPRRLLAFSTSGREEAVTRKATLALGALLVLAGCGGGGPAETAASPRPSLTAATTCKPAGTSLAIVAKTNAFDKDCLAAPAGRAFTITIDNRDDTEHNVAILRKPLSEDPYANALFRGLLVSGPAKMTYRVKALNAGTYPFICDVHPLEMFGVFIVA